MKTKTLIVTGRNFIGRATMAKVDGRWFVLQSDPSIRWIRPWVECSAHLLPNILERNKMKYRWEINETTS